MFISFLFISSSAFLLVCEHDTLATVRPDCSKTCTVTTNEDTVVMQFMKPTANHELKQAVLS
jgi:hypothetical protein